MIIKTYTFSEGRLSDPCRVRKGTYFNGLEALAVRARLSIMVNMNLL
jgi:hypothetical protein